MIDQNTLRINFNFVCLLWEIALALYCNASITGFPLIVVGLIDVHWDQEGHSISMPWQRTDKETLFSELALHLASTARASDRMWLAVVGL